MLSRLLLFLVVWLPLVANNSHHHLQDLHHNQDSERIFNGTDAPFGQWPFFVHLSSRKVSQFCGGSILDAETILTAAHCVWDKQPGDIMAIVTHMGSEEFLDRLYEIKNHSLSYVHWVRKIISHKQYIWNVTIMHDIALLKLATPLSFGRAHSTYDRTCIAGKKAKPVLAKCVLVAWGQYDIDISTSTPYLQYLEQQIVPCVKVYSLTEPWLEVGANFNDVAFCARPIAPNTTRPAPCVGDSGSPLVCPLVDEEHVWIQFGVFFFLDTDQDTNMCGQMHGIYVNVTAYLPWILQHLGE